MSTPVNIFRILLSDRSRPIHDLTLKVGTPDCANLTADFDSFNHVARKYRFTLFPEGSLSHSSCILYPASFNSKILPPSLMQPKSFKASIGVIFRPLCMYLKICSFCEF